jgi:OmpA-OmpF porin, OOP family
LFWTPDISTICSHVSGLYWDKNMKRRSGHSFLVALFTALSVGSGTALSQDVGFYAGFNFGESKADDVDCTGTTVCDDKDIAFSIFGGYQFNRNFGIELGYVDLGRVSFSVPRFAGPVAIRFESTGLEVSGVGTMPINQQFSFYGKLGLFLWDLDVRATGPGGTAALSEDGTDLTFALGAGYRLMKDVALHVQWQRYNDIGDGFTTGKSDIDLIGVGLLFRF